MFVDGIGNIRGHDHHDSHHKQPDKQLHLYGLVLGPGGFGIHRQQDKSDQGNAGHTVRFETVGARADRITRVVTGAVRDDAWIACIVFFDFEFNLHQVGTDVRDLGKDTTRDSQRRGT